jgi:hypothetical protein
MTQENIFWICCSTIKSSIIQGASIFHRLYFSLFILNSQRLNGGGFSMTLPEIHDDVSTEIEEALAKLTPAAPKTVAPASLPGILRHRPGRLCHYPESLERGSGKCHNLLGCRNPQVAGIPLPQIRKKQPVLPETC